MNTTRTTDICRQMSHVRLRLGDDVEGIVQSARTLADWQHYVRTYPWLCLAGAAVVGFLVVPTRVEIVSPNAEVLEELANRNKLAVMSNPPPRVGSGIGGAIFRALANAAARGAISYVGQSVGKLFGDAIVVAGEENANSNP